MRHALCVLLLFAACGRGVPEPPGEILRSELSRDLAPQVSQGDRAEVAGGVNDLAFDLLALQRDDPGNVFLSSLSISTALAMTWGGARGETAAQMADALHYTVPPERLHPAMNWLDLELGSRDEGPVTLRLVNATFAQAGYRFLPDYLDRLMVHYGAGVSLLDFAGGAEAARTAINGWVAEATEKKIPELFAPGVITGDARLVLVNALYLEAPWLTAFPSRATADGTFHLESGAVVTAPFMHVDEAPMRHARGAGWEAVAVPYEGETLSLWIVVPDAGTFRDFEASLDRARLDAVGAALEDAEVTLALPRFELTWQTQLGKDLRALGMVDAFGGEADFSGMDGTRSLYLQAVVHEAYVLVDEAGTKAAAATGVVVGERSAGGPRVTVDRPFFFFVRDEATSVILFAGRLLDPTG